MTISITGISGPNSLFTYLANTTTVIIPQGFTNDGTEVTADDASNYFGGAIMKISINPTVTFKVVNGSWDDDTTAAKTVTLTGYEGDTLTLAASQIPAVGSKPNDTYKSGSWDVTPSTNTAITEATTYTYTYAQKESAVDLAPDTPSSSDDETYFFVPDGTKDDEVATAKDPTYQWRKNSGDSLLFVIKSVSNDDQTFGKFKGGVCVDGNVVDSKYFTAATGSLRLTLKLEYLNTLSVSEHTLTIQFEDGTVTHKFTILSASAGSDSPGTGENGMTIALNCLLLVISAAGAAYVMFRQKKAAA